MSKRHLFHILEVSPWPILSGFSSFFLLSSLAFYMHMISYSGFFLVFSFLFLLLCVFSWFYDIIQEATIIGDHSLIVRNGLRYGFLLFVLSEFMLFFGFFWAFFHASLDPSCFLGCSWPPVAIQIVPIFEFPLFNTGLLLVSGFSITWAHRGLALGSYLQSIDAFIITIFLGTAFLFLQMYEYYEAAFDISDSVYASVFYMLTGLHGLHVFVGVSFIAFCFVRLLSRHFLTKHYLGFVFAVWYWHFVDVVWLLLFVSVYCWSSL